MQGWVKLHRKILDNPIICKDSEYFSVWCYLMLNATHAEYDVEFKNERITLKSGQLITGRKSISEKFNISDSKVQRILKKLEIEQQIEQQTSTKNRLISIVNWDQYQKSEQQEEQPVNNERTTSEQQVNTNKNVKKDKKVNNDKNEYIYTDFVFNQELINTIESFKEMRKSIKSPMTDGAIKLLVNKLEKLAGGNDELKIEILNQSIMCGWKGIFAISQTKLFDNGKKQYKNNTNAVEDFFGGIYGADDQQPNAGGKTKSEDNSTINVSFSECED